MELSMVNQNYCQPWKFWTIRIVLSEVLKRSFLTLHRFSRRYKVDAIYHVWRYIVSRQTRHVLKKNQLKESSNIGSRPQTFDCYFCFQKIQNGCYTKTRHLRTIFYYVLAELIRNRRSLMSPQISTTILIAGRLFSFKEQTKFNGESLLLKMKDEYRLRTSMCIFPRN